MSILHRVSVASGLGAVLVASVGLALAQTRAPVHPPLVGSPLATSVPTTAPASTHVIAVAPASAPAKPPLVRTMSGGGAYTTLPADARTSIVNAARAQFGYAVISEQTAIALRGGVLLTPVAPVSGNNSLSFRWQPVVASGYAAFNGAAYVFSPVPATFEDTVLGRGYVYAAFETVKDNLYVAECAYTSTQSLTVAFYLESGRFNPPHMDGAAVAKLDPKTHRALFAFKAKDVASRVQVFAYRTPGTDPPGDGGEYVGGVGGPQSMSFSGCSLIPAG